MTSPAAPAATTVARFVLNAVKQKTGSRWNQGPRMQPWPLAADADAAIGLIATRRLCGVPEPAAQAVLAWHQGLRPVHLLYAVPTARQMLRWQAKGQRCVALLDDVAAKAHGDPRHPDGLSFVLHDLCHLEKFVDPEHHAGQVGFFSQLDAALDHPAWAELESGFDEVWRADRDYVLADMNGSAIFLFAALKMKLKMAVRRLVGQPPGGPLTAAERAAYEPRREALVRLLGLQGGVMDAARQVSARRTNPEAAAELLAWFEARGRARLAEEAGQTPQPVGAISL